MTTSNPYHAFAAVRAALQARPDLDQCEHETLIAYPFTQGEGDRSLQYAHQCIDPGTVHSLGTDRDLCLRHFSKEVQ